MKRTCNFVIGSLVWDTQWRGWEHHFLSTSATFCHYIWFAIYRYIFSVYIVAFQMGWKLDVFTHVDVLIVLWTWFVSKSTHLMIQVVWYITDVILLTFVRIISWISRVDDYRGSTKKNTTYLRKVLMVRKSVAAVAQSLFWRWICILFLRWPGPGPTCF